jgi:hypothetical protein
VTRQRNTALIVGAAATAAIILISFFKAPVLPVAVGAVVAVAWLLRRAWREDASSY